MKNYEQNLKELEEYFNESIEFLEGEIIEEGKIHLASDLMSFSIARKFIYVRMEFYLKYYNNDENKIDDYVMNKILNEFSLFANTSYSLVASMYSEDVERISAIKKRLNNIANYLYSLDVIKDYTTGKR